MFSFFKRKSPIDKLQAQYEKHMAEAHRLSTINRTASDAQVKEANDILERMDAIQKANK